MNLIGVIETRLAIDKQKANDFFVMLKSYFEDKKEKMSGHPLCDKRCRSLYVAKMRSELDRLFRFLFQGR